MTPDTLMIVEQFKNTLAMMHQTMVQMGPIVEHQLQVIASQRLIANIMLFFCFGAALTALLFSLKSAQNARHIWNVSMKKRWLGLLIGAWALSLLLFNVVPGMILMNMDKQVSGISANYSKARLFGQQNTQEGTENAQTH